MNYGGMSSTARKIIGKIINYWHIFSANKLSVVGLIIILVFVVMALGAEIIAPHSPTRVVARRFQPPSSMYLLGTDDAGRDVFSQIVYGSRVSLLVGVSAAAISTLLGLMIGLISGYFGGIIDGILMRITDVFLIIPMIPLAILLAVYVGPSLTNIIILFGLLTWPGTARQIRSQILSMKELPFVEALHALGASSKRIIFFHLLPNTVGVAFANMIGVSVGAIIGEAGLSFLGVTDPRNISWGRILSRSLGGGAIIYNAWWTLVSPGFCIALLACGFSFLSHGLTLLVSPHLRRKIQ